MPRLRILLLGLLAMLALSSVASATASAELRGPWWRHPESSKQVKWPENEEHAITASNAGLGNFKLITKGNPILGNVTIECKKVTSTGNIWNGLRQGEDNANVLFEECSSVGTISGKCPEGIGVSETKTYSELMWKYRGEAKELTEVGQQKIYDAFAPTNEPKGGKAVFTVITFPEGCVGHGTNFEVVASGSEATFVEQNQKEHPIVWGTAALVEPQNGDATKGFLHWILPNVTKLHHQEKEVVAKLEFAGHPAELEGTVAVELNAGGMFGAYNE